MMYKKQNKNHVLLLLCFFIASVGFSQHLSHTNNAGGFVKFKKKKRYWSVGASCNAMNYVGDLDPAENIVSPALRYTKPSFGAIVSYRYSPRLTFRGTFNWGRIKGNDIISDKGGRDQFRRMRNSDFRNTIVELKFDVMYDFVKNLGDFTHRPVKTIPYLFAGIAGFYHNPKGTYNGKWIELQPLQTEGVSYSKYQIAIPFGIGFRWKLSRVLDLAFEIGWRKTFTGYLDDVNKVYVDPKTQDPLAAEMANKSVNWIDQPENPSAYANEKQGSDALRALIKDGAPNVAYDRIFYNPETQKIEFWGWGRAGDQRGKYKGKTDWYILTGVHLTYIIGGRIVCPKFRD